MFLQAQEVVGRQDIAEGDVCSPFREVVVAIAHCEKPFLLISSRLRSDEKSRAIKFNSSFKDTQEIRQAPVECNATLPPRDG